MTEKPVCLADVKAGIEAGVLFIQFWKGRIYLGSFQTGECIRLSNIEVEIKA